MSNTNFPTPAKSKQSQSRKTYLESFWCFLVIISLVGIFALRIYAIYNTVVIRTWDDAQYRRFALQDVSPALGLTGTKALTNLIFPNGNILDNTRSIGYHSWIVLALKLSLSGDPEQCFQLANLILYIFQTVLLFCFGCWATRNKIFAATLTFLYLSSPIVFGLNRWVMTENFVMTGLLAFGYLPAWLLTKNHKTSIRREIIAGIGVAWVMGIFASLREYAIPSYLLPSFCTASTLLWSRRWDAFWSFSTVTSIFTLTMIEGWIQLFKIASFKFTQSEYYHPFGQWFKHEIIYVFGIALSILLFVGLFFIFKTAITRFKVQWRDRQESGIFSFATARLQPLHFLWLSFFTLFFVYAIFFFRSDNRLARSGIVFMFTILNFLLIGIRVLDIPSQLFRKSAIQLFCIAIIACSWSTLYYQLFIAFDGGKTFAFPAYDLEWYNHPYFLRPLNSPDDMHTYY
jgi:hypothetical protein